MGKAVEQSVELADDLVVSGVWTRGSSLDEILAASDVLVDFSLPAANAEVLAAVSKHKTPLVCGVSGLHAEQLAAMKTVAAAVPMVFDRNMSLGIAILEKSVREAAASLGAEFAVHVSEVHHVHKKDAPSGTALKLGEAIAASRGESGTGAVQFEVERRGEIPGDHEVTMTSATEKLTFAHSVTTRQVFVDGALTAAAWVIGRAPGRYSMQDVLFSHPNS